MKLFISHASEDKDSCARPLAKMLQNAGVAVWYDEYELKLGDNLVEKIDNGLKECDYGVVILSKSFFKKPWPKKELDGLIAKETNNSKIVLPIWHDISFEDVNTFSPILASKIGVSTDKGLSDVFDSIISSIENRHNTHITPKKLTFSIKNYIEMESDVLSKSRRIQIVDEYENYILSGKLKKHRSEHKKKLQQYQKRKNVNFNKPAWCTVATTSRTKRDSPNEIDYYYAINNSLKRLIVGFQNHGCRYRKENENKGCFHCGFYAGNHPPPKPKLIASLLEQFKAGLSFGLSTGENFEVIEFLSDGSFLDDDEIPEKAKKNIFKAIRKMPYINRVLVESTPNRVYHERKELLTRIKELRNNQDLEIGIGIETSDDFIRNICLNKGYHREEFERAIDHVLELPEEYRNRISIIGYVLVKPPWITDGEAVCDAIETINYLYKLSKQKGITIIPVLEPAIISEGTLLSLLWKDGKYEPLNYWAVLEILTSIYYHDECSSMLSSIRIGTRGDMDESSRIPAVYDEYGRYDKYDFVIYRSIQSFNQHGDLSKTIGIIDAVYTLEESRLLGRSQSLMSWLTKSFNNKGVDSTILKYVSDNSNDIKMIQNNESVKDEIKYVHKLFKFLDIVEGYRGDAYFEYALSWKIKIAECTEPEDYKKIENEISLQLNETLKTIFEYSKLTVEEIHVEEKGDQLFRMRIHILDELTRQSYEIMSGTPTNYRNA